MYKVVSRKEAEIMLSALWKIKESVVTFAPPEDYLMDAMHIALSERIPIYDALYLAQAKEFGKLLTSDKKQLTVARKIGIRTEYME
ncbi:MAG: type II toxin-antitoxin system VapC family toxin [Candidatus Freyarchaeota archaeon]